MIAYDMRISDWSSDVCSSDLAYRNAKQRSFARRCNDIWSHSAPIYALRTAVGLRDRPEAAPPPPASMRWPNPCWSHRLEEWRPPSAPVDGIAEQPHQNATHFHHTPHAPSPKTETENPLYLQPVITAPSKT